MDIELVADIVTALGRSSDVPSWRYAHATVLRRRAQERNGRISTARAQITHLSLDEEYSLIAHEQECSELVDELVGRVNDSERPPAVAYVSGLPGIGKTVLARSTARRVAAHLGTRSVIEAAFRTNAGGSEGAPDPGDVGAEILRVHKTMDARPDEIMVVVLDDVTSLDDISVVASILPANSIVIATSRRSFAAPDGLATVTLEPLSDAHAARLLKSLITSNSADTLSDAAPEEAIFPRLAALTSGLPLGIVLLAGQLGADKGWSLEDHLERLENSSPSTLAPSLAAAYEQLSPGARHALQLLAQYPGRVSDAEATAYLHASSIAGSTAWLIADALDELSREHFLSRTAAGRYELHDVVRALALEHARTEEPLSLRRGAARDPSRTLEEVLRTTTLGPEAIASFNESVEGHLASVALAADHGLTAEVTAHALALHSWLATTTRWNDIIFVNEHSRRIATDADRPDIERRLCLALTAVGRLDEAEIILTNLASAPEADPEVHNTTVMLADVAGLRGDLELCVQLAERALEGAREAQDGRVIVWASSLLAQTLCEVGRAEDGVKIMERTQAEYPLFDAPLTRIAGIIDLGAVLVWADRLADARAQFTQALSEAAEIGHRGIMLFCEGWIGTLDVLTGETAKGRAALVVADDGLREFGRERPRAWIKYLLAEACLADGDPVAAAEVAAEAIAMSEEYRFDDLASFVRVTLGAVAIAEGRDDDARSILDALRDDSSSRARALAREQLGVLAQRSGDTDAATTLWHEALALNPAPRVATGITLRAPDGTHTVTAATVTAHEINDTYDLIIITVKARALAAVVDDIAPAVGATTTIVPFLNGMLHIDSLEARYPGRVAGGIIKIVASLDERGGAIQANGMADVIVGPLGQTPLPAAIGAALDVPGLASRTSDDATQDLWEKWAFIAATGVITCLFTNSVGAVRAAGGLAYITDAIAETVAVAAAAGHPPREESVAWTTTVLTEEGSPLTSSLFRDLTAGLPTEGEQILGDLAERARRLGVSTPLLDLAVVRVRAAELSRRAAS
mgnify:FL=1